MLVLQGRDSSCLGIVLVKAAASEWQQSLPQLSCRCEGFEDDGFSPPRMKFSRRESGGETRQLRSTPAADPDDFWWPVRLQVSRPRRCYLRQNLKSQAQHAFGFNDRIFSMPVCVVCLFVSHNPYTAPK